ncbi:hypothetical protein BDY21DRAFT_332257 [Lineolata rhizophorae]|uniref:Major facilitator superfamily transporter n=1 Tax=Lineolata rhizophorae TaxID=578093 RepID=A0A6A6PC18_9PEZI|nr:hypothetical protein BDY21DRAFT_332257 [Lineolata rhizophorae]
MRSFNPLSLARRKLPAYSSVPTYASDDELDVEKLRRSPSSVDGSSYDSSAASSRNVSGSCDGMMGAARRSPSPRGGARSSNAYTYRAPRKFSRYFALAIGSTIVLFVLTLTRLSWVSSKKVELGVEKAPKPPPPWEKFPFLKRYHGGIRTLVSREENEPEYPGDGPNIPEPSSSAAPKGRRDEPEEDDASTFPASTAFNPYPDYTSEEYVANYTVVRECFLDDEETIRIPMLQSYPGVTSGMPDNVMGSYDIFGLRDDVCFERFGRLGPYGLGYGRNLGGTGAGMEGDREGIDDVWALNAEVDFREVKWADVQKRCLEANKHRFKPMPPHRNHFFLSMGAGGPAAEAAEMDPAESDGTVLDKRQDSQAANTSDNSLGASTPTTLVANQHLRRTAVLIRTWWNYKYDQEDIMYLRALISELSIRSGGEYTVHFLIHVKDDNKQIWADDDIYQQVLNDSLPEEFRGMGTLWSERQMGLIYGGVAESFYRNLPVHGAYRSTFMPVQYFAHQHPEYDFFWHWEMDVRYTGNYYHLFDKVDKFARDQPRKGLWERNSRFYVPSEHGSWEDFKQLVRFQTEQGTNNRNNIYAEMAATDPNSPDSASLSRPERPIWGPEPPIDDDIDTSEDPKPPTELKDDDYSWGVGEDADLITFNPLFDPAGTNWILAEDVTGYNTTRGLPPRRTAIITTSRLSRRLLARMHAETSLGRHTMFSEMWPGSCALHHGLKAVYAPHPVYVDRRWPTDYLAAIFNGGRNGAAGGARGSVFSDERQHNFKGTTWYYDAGFAPNLWKRWLGYKVDNDGGEQWEVANEGRMCLPAMLLHPVKQVDLVYEHQAGED